MKLKQNSFKTVCEQFKTQYGKWVYDTPGSSHAVKHDALIT